MVAGRAVLDTLVQSSIVELFRNYAIAVAPTQRSSRLPASLVQFLAGVGSLSAPGINGALTLLIPLEVVADASDEGVRPSNELDWVRELTNQILGRLRNRLAQYRTTLQVGAPTATRGGAVRKETFQNPYAVYAFRALRGELFVVLTGHIDCSSFVYSPAETTIHEGDVLLF